MCIFMFTFRDGEEDQLIADGTSITVRDFLATSMNSARQFNMKICRNY